MPRPRALAHGVLRAAISIAVLAYILIAVDRGDLWRAASSVHPAALVLPFGLYLVGQVLSAVKWWMLGTAVGLSSPLADYVRFYFIGMFLNVFGLSTLGGDVVRGLYLGGGHRPALALDSVVFDRVSGLAILMAMGALALLAFPGFHLPAGLSAALIAGGLGLVIAWWTCPLLVRLLPPGNRVRRQVEDDLAPFWTDRRMLVLSSLVSVVFHLSQVGVQWLLARAAGAPIPFSYCLVMHPVLSVMMALPISLGGFGVREGGYLWFLRRIGVDDSVAVTVGLLWWLMSALSGIVGAAVFLASGAELPRLRSRPAPDVA